jgi:hypothetical protein
MAIGLVGDITRSVGDRSQPFCDNFMNYLLNNLRVRSVLADCLVSEAALDGDEPEWDNECFVVGYHADDCCSEHYPVEPVQARHPAVLW